MESAGSSAACRELAILRIVLLLCMHFDIFLLIAPLCCHSLLFRQTAHLICTDFTGYHVQSPPLNRAAEVGGAEGAWMAARRYRQGGGCERC